MMMSSGEEETELFTMHEKTPSSAVPPPVIKSLAKRRSRQRVDAGEPRNSYASIPNYSLKPPQLSPLPLTSSSNLYPAYNRPNMLNDLSGRPLPCDSDMILNDSRMMIDSEAKINPEDIYRNLDHQKSQVLRQALGRNSHLCSSTGRPSRSPSPVSSCDNSVVGAEGVINEEDMDDDEEEGGSVDGTSDQMATIPISSNDRCMLVQPSQQPQLIVDELLSNSDSCAGRNIGAGRCNKPLETARPNSCQNSFSSRDVNKPPQRNMGDSAAATSPNRHTDLTNQSTSPAHPAMPTPSPEPSTSPSGTLSDGTLVDRSSDSPGRKRARVENIVTSIVGSNSPQQNQSQKPQVNGCNKRKQYHPQQHDSVSVHMSTCDSDEEDYEWTRLNSAKREKKEESVRSQIKWLREQLSVVQEQYISLVNHSTSAADLSSDTDGQAPTAVCTNGGNVSDDTNSKASPDVSEDDEEDDKEDEDEDVSKSDLIKEEVNYRKGIHQPEGFVDPSSFIDEARRLVSEQQEKLAKESEAPTPNSVADVHPNFLPKKVERPINPSNISGAQQMANAAALLSNVVEMIKLELSSSIPRIVDTIVANCVTHQPRSLLMSAQKLISENKDLNCNLDRKSPRTKVSDRGRNAGSNTVNFQATSTPISSSNNKDSFMIGMSPFNDRSLSSKQSPAVFPSVAKMPTAPLNIMSGVGLPTSSHPSPNLPQFSQSSTNGNNSVLSESSPEQTEAISLVIPTKKKRTKVTDTRPSSRSIRSFGHDSESPNPSNGKFIFPYSTGSENSPSPFHPGSMASIVPNTLPTSVAIPNPSLHQSDIFSAAAFPFDPSSHRRLGGSNPMTGSWSRDEADLVRTAANHHLSSLQQHLLLNAPQHSTPSEVHSMRSFQNHHVKGDLASRDAENNNNDLHNVSNHMSSNDILSYENVQRFDLNLGYSSTLSPMHLRKAKLMFFHVRYPSSAVLKTFFPDIKFNKNNTAQLVKWFSNFREFYYIQMEKYARQAASEGIKNCEDITVTLDSELYRVLNLHYNRNNHIEVPTNFRYVIEQSLREFFKAVLAGKDTEQSWKKSIYKVIARLDDNVPEYFKSPNFLEQLE